MSPKSSRRLPARTAPAVSVQDARDGLEDFETLMFEVLESWNLPTEKIVVDLRQRELLLRNTPEVILNELTDEERSKAPYLAKMIMAGSVGLFDAALNYLWNETINRLRDHVAAFDVAYFFDLAESDPTRRKNLKTRDDLAKLDDYKLLEAANKIKLISDAGYTQLVTINYMRNHASAAHPNVEELTGLKLADWLETCIKEVFQLEPRTVVAEIGKLLSNIKSKRLKASDLAKAAAFFSGLPDDQADNLAAGLFGIYTPADGEPDVLDNVRSLWPELWPEVSEEARNELGIKLARYTANADFDRADRARELLELVDGAAYLPESERVAEIQSALDDLKRAHEGWNNFYEEPPAAQRLKDVVGRHGDIPAQVTQSYVQHLVYVFLTNSRGVAWNAELIYEELIRRFDTSQAAIALRSFAVRAIRLKLQDKLPREKWEALVDLIAPKLTGRADRALLGEIRAFNGTPDELWSDTKIKADVKRWFERNRG